MDQRVRRYTDQSGATIQGAKQKTILGPKPGNDTRFKAERRYKDQSGKRYKDERVRRYTDKAGRMIQGSKSETVQ